MRAELPTDVDVVAFQCRNPIHRAHYELFTRALDDPMLRPGAVVLVHPTCGPTQVSLSRSLRFKGLYLYTVGILFHVEWRIG